jgi:hypothetical protein
MKKASQNDRVLDYMEEFGSITQLQAFADLGISRLAARISDLKEDGYIIKAEPTKVRNRFGETSTVSRYSLVKGDLG